MNKPAGMVIEVNPPRNPMPGQRVQRKIAGMDFMKMEIAAVTETEIGCWPLGQDGIALRNEAYLYRFDRQTGAEIDDELGWGPPTPENPDMWTGSYIEEMPNGRESGVDVPRREEVSGRGQPRERSEPEEGQGIDKLQRPDEVRDNSME